MRVIYSKEAMEILELCNSVKNGCHTFTEKEIEYINGIECIEFRHQRIADISGIKFLTNLVELDLTGTSIESIEPFCNLLNLERLWLAYTKIRSVEEIHNLKKLSSLSIAGTDVHSMKEIGMLENLCSLDISCIRNIDLKGIEKLHSLRKIIMQGNKIKSINELEQLPALESLDLSDTDIDSFEDLQKLSGLKELFLDNTLITDLKGIEKLVDLEELSLGGLKITNLEGVDSLKKLRRLDLDNLSLKNVPKDIALLPQIVELEKPYCIDLINWEENGIIMYGSNLSTQPLSLFEQPKELVKAYYDAPKIPINESKVVFLGNGGAGKTYTIQRIINGGKKKRYHTDTTPGIAISSFHVEQDGTRFDINFWDFGGQEIMHSMHRCFLTGRTCYVIVIYNRNESLDRQARYWLRNIESFAEGCPVILAVNCFDDSFTEGVDSQKLRADFPNLGDIITYSAKCSDEREFQRLTDAIIKQARKMDSCGMEFPENWASIRRGLLNYAAEGMPYIDNQQYYKLCDKYGEKNSEIRKWLLEWFNDLGICFSYHLEDDGNELGEYKVLSPKWLTNAIYIIINSGKGRSKQGVILKQTIIDILNMESTGVESSIRYTEDEVDYVLAVMRKFRLSYKLPNEEGEAEEEFIPALCSYIEPKDVYPQMDYQKHFVYQMRYRYLPDNVIHQLMISCYNNLNTNKIWRQGMRIDEKFHDQCAIVSVKDEKVLQIDIYSNQEQPTWTVVQYLRNQISQINGRLNIKATDYIIKNKNKQIASFPVESVLKAKQRGRIEMDCSDGGEFETYQISDILDDSFGNENVEKYMKKIQNSQENISVDTLANIVRNTNVYFNCNFGDVEGISAEKIVEIISTFLEHEERMSKEAIDAFVKVLVDNSQNENIKNIADNVIQQKDKRSKLDYLQKISSLGVNAIKIGEAMKNALPIIEQRIPEIWAVIEPVFR